MVLEQTATDEAIHWAKSGTGYFAMERTVNDYIEAVGANMAIGTFLRDGAVAGTDEHL